MFSENHSHSHGRGRYALVALDFIEQLDSAQTMEEMFQVLERTANQLGFEGVSYTYIPPVILNNLEISSPIFVKSDSFSDGFICHYEEENLGEHDFVIKRVQESDFQPVHWWQEVERRRLTGQEKYVVDVARSDYDIENAISIPTYKRDDGVAGITITSQERKYYFDKLFDERINIFKQLCRIFSDRIMLNPKYHVQFVKPFLDTLSYTEKQVLIALANGIPLKKAASQLKISPGYASNVMEKLKSKFGNVSRDQLFYLAGVMNITELRH
jgi:DNA-binding CsgD family transcriptional regulator